MIGPLVEALEAAPIFRFVKHSRSGVSFEAVPIQRILARLAGGSPVNVDAFEDAYPLPCRVIEAWEQWWAAKRRGS
jgi:hypothetical protein